MRRGYNKIDEELVCIDALVQHLKRVDANSLIEAKREKSDPPDYWLKFGENRFAVEITSIVQDQVYSAQCDSLILSIKNALRESGDSVQGTYAVEFFRSPEIPGRWTGKWKKLVEDTVDRIRCLAGPTLCSESRVFQDTRGHITISKWSDKGSAVGMLRVPEAKYEGEANDELSVLMEQAIGKKFKSLQKKNVMAKCPDVILLLYDAYGYGSIETAKSALFNIKGYEWLHSIFWAASFSDCSNVIYPDSPGRSGGFLYSIVDGW
jgi:hypothetical protein